MTNTQELTETLRQAQRFGFFGDAPIETAIDHAHQFVRAIGQVPVGTRVLDLGSGGGLPGLVLAAAFPDAFVVLLDRREKRTDFLQRAVTRLGYGRAEVWCDDADQVVDAVRSGAVEPFDVVTARGFGPPVTTIRTAAACIGPSGQIVISEPPTGDRWPVDVLEELGLTSQRVGGVRRFRARSDS